MAISLTRIEWLAAVFCGRHLKLECIEPCEHWLTNSADVEGCLCCDTHRAVIADHLALERALVEAGLGTADFDHDIVGEFAKLAELHEGGK